MPSGDWLVWLLLAGRGFGKTRTGAEAVRQVVEAGQAWRVALVAPTAADARDVMVEGESGMLAVCPDWNRPAYEPSKRRLTWRNGAIATLYSADEPERLRGPQHDFAWADELAAWRYAADAWAMLQFGLRLGDRPRAVVTTTPKPIQIIRDLLASKHTHVTRGTTYDNRDNLAPAFFTQIVSRYEGTTLGRQELMAEVIDDMPGALWTRATLDAHRADKAPTLERIVVAIDPAATSSGESNATGIVVVGIGADRHGYVLEDLTLRGTPDRWGRVAVEAYHRHNADLIVAEVNQGGDMVEHVLRTVERTIPYRGVHAAKGKRPRAEPIAALYEQGRVHHVGRLVALEDELCGWVPDSGMQSPDRLDACVWGLTELRLSGSTFPGGSGFAA